MKKLIRWFKAADKQILMDKDEYEAYQMLPNTVDIYRGIASKSNLNGISWTTNFETAKWFANRWNKNGYVVKAKIFKNNVLSYYLRRGEYEIIAEVPKSEIIRI